MSRVSKTFSANGKRYRIREKPRIRLDGQECWGVVDHETRVVSIDHSAKDLVRLDTIIHEFLHCWFDSGRVPLLHEDAITTCSTDLANLLWGLGYREQR